MTLFTDLEAPRAYSYAVDHVEHIETHISHLYLAGDFVFKVKKPVDLGFLDYSTIEQRRSFCHEEVRLNRRLAPDTYLGVVAIRTSPDGQVSIDGEDGEIIDWAVKMRRLPAERMLDKQLDSADIDNERIRQLARLLAQFHSSAPTGEGIDEYGSLSTIRANCQENFDQTLPFLDEPGNEVGLLSTRIHGFLEDRTLSFLESRAPLFEQRVAAGRIRDGHGDLHAGNVCMLPDGVVVYDCIEFAARFRCCDVAADLAFLLMDLDLRQFRAFGGFLLHEYTRLSTDSELAELTPFYKTYRAMVRGKVEAMALRQSVGTGNPTEDAARRNHAASYFHLAAAYELPNVLIATCGLPGCGKSYAAKRIARPLGATTFNSDRVRKRMDGIHATQRVSTGIDRGLYDASHTAGVYEQLRDLARAELKKGRPVVIDAGLRTRAQRQIFTDLANELGIPFLQLHVDTAEDVILERLRAREHDGREVSDAGVEVYQSLAARFEAPEEIPTDQRVTYDGTSPLPDLVTEIIDALILQA